MKVINACGTQVDYEVALNLMNDEIREYISENFAPCTEQEFFRAYEQEHFERYGTDWELSKANPCY